jgi:alpha-methylacyl-CoA racemase
MIGPQGGAPVPPLNLVGDYAGGALYLAFGVVCAVMAARASGEGQVVDAAMVDGTANLLTVFHGLRQMGELVSGRGMNLLDGGAPQYGTYRTRDGGYVAVGAVESRFYANLLAGLELDPATLPVREDRSNWPELRARIGARFLTRPRDEWARHFEGRDACVSPVLSLEEAGGHPHNAARRMLLAVDGVEHPHPAPRLSRTPGAVCRTAPRRGEHTAEVLRAWGFDEGEITAGLNEGVFAAS